MKRIMIVDDSLVMRINLKKIFERQGYTVIAEASNGQEAIEKYEKFKPDLVTMDITMPIMDGIAALQQIRKLDSKAVVVMISALGQEKKIIEAINSGARHYILKPINESDVIAIIRNVINSVVEEKLNVS